MDIQKEDDDFNAWFNKQTINAVPDADLSLQRLWASLAWQAQAAKAQAVPEGFVVVNKEDLVKVLNCVSDDWLIETESLEKFKNIESLVQLEIESMIESWSQNDH